MDPEWGHFQADLLSPTRHKKRSCGDLLKLLETWVTSPADDRDMWEAKVVVSIASLVVAFCGFIWGTLYILLGAFLSCIFPFMAAMLCVCGLIHILNKKKIEVARRCLCFGLCGCALAVHCTFGGQSSNVIAWAFLAPQIAIYAGSQAKLGCILMAASILIAVLYFILQHFFPSLDMTAQQIILPKTWGVLLQAINTAMPWLVSFILTWFLLARLRKQRAELENNILKAEVIAQLIVDFDLDNEILDTMEDKSVISLLQQIACNLKVYRPYLPAHLLMKACEVQEVALPDPVSPQGNNGVTLPHSPADISCDVSPRTAALQAKASFHVHRSSPVLRTPTVDLPHSTQSGTLLYIQLHDLLNLITSDCPLERIRQASNLFASVVAAVLKETGGVLQTIQHNSCLASFNFMASCRMHAENACQAAVSIRDRLRELEVLQQLPSMSVSMGVWAGTLVAGSFGTDDIKATGVLGRGTSRAMELQHYAATHRRTIIANAEVHKLISITPRSRLLPVDVLAMTQCQSLKECADPSLSRSAEVIYEVLGTVQVTHDEWMYELQMTASAHTPEKKLDHLFCQLRDGVTDTFTFKKDVMQLSLSRDPAVQEVCTHLMSVIKETPRTDPYHLRFFQSWVPSYVTNPFLVTTNTVNVEAETLPLPETQLLECLSPCATVFRQRSRNSIASICSMDDECRSIGSRGSAVFVPHYLKTKRTQSSCILMPAISPSS